MAIQIQAGDLFGHGKTDELIDRNTFFFGEGLQLPTHRHGQPKWKGIGQLFLFSHDMRTPKDFTVKRNLENPFASDLAEW